MIACRVDRRCLRFDVVPRLALTLLLGVTATACAHQSGLRAEELAAADRGLDAALLACDDEAIRTASGPYPDAGARIGIGVRDHADGTRQVEIELAQSVTSEHARCVMEAVRRYARVPSLSDPASPVTSFSVPHRPRRR